MRVSSAACYLAIVLLQSGAFARPMPDNGEMSLVVRSTTSTRGSSTRTSSGTAGHSTSTGSTHGSSSATTNSGTRGTSTSTGSSAHPSSTASGASCARKTTRSLFARAALGCGDKVKFKQKEYVLGNPLGEGASGAAFDVAEKVENHVAVAKVYNNAAEGEQECARTAKAGQAIGQEKQTDGTLVGFQVKQPGDKLTDWPTWQAYFKDKKVSKTAQEQCRDLMQAVREAIADQVVAHSKRPGVDYYHTDYANNGNILLRGTSPDAISVILIDWGHVSPKGSKTEAQIREEVMNRLKNDKNPLNVFKKTTSKESATHNAFSDASCDPELFGNPWGKRLIEILSQA
ncbi:hypothetical protein K435DRAFT_339396 [Dendrothele bispora CBS 962.96]|uniref:Aminoglycoside phosphotransferase domain-containing protein n=1 Tax=Dendrothele bispora (strain CBS 962.96) TaxID=1314807 RepID=A0A4S8MIS3_DENBC|nr:hypothetical protein K435DRAFT_339396 [Dendrothele bispora CBS 962.96]